ncbi:MAG: DnaJ domain-containing protein [Candidatus Taylorbacteria bacterium]|nr:DnaJ domain-containing protein [Candidatus Taylorbacteria bacterium]
MRFLRSARFLAVAIVAVAISLGAYAYFAKGEEAAAPSYKTEAEKDLFVRFVMEGYDSIMENYWAKTSEKDLANHFQLSLQKAQNSILMPVLANISRSGTAAMIEAALSAATSTDAKKRLALDTLNVALYNLEPVGRNGLLSQTQETAFREDVANVDSSKDLYEDLGLKKGASEEEVRLAYEAKAEALLSDPSPEAKEKLEKIAYAKSVLADPNTKDLYDEAKIEPTASKSVYGKTLYMKIDRISPTTLLEFARGVYAATTTPGLDSMIIDLRGNLGGALDFAAAFLGLFLGQNQYAFDLFHQGDYEVQRTSQPRFPELSRYKEIAVLTDGMTQSTAEVTAAAFKRFKLGTVIGEPTRGWGTVENTFPLQSTVDEKDKYLLLLVHSITLRDDGGPVEGRGVDPDIDTRNPSWSSELSSKIDSSSLVKAVKDALSGR